jgi:S1-C subfamily serine protease
MLSTIGTLLAGAACGALMLTPALAAADHAGAAASSRNLTQEQQQAGAIPLPSFAPLAQQVLPAVVNISVELNQQTALQGESSGEDQGSSGNNGSNPEQFGQQFRGSPFDQFLRRFFESPFSMPRQGRQVAALVVQT